VRYPLRRGMRNLVPSSVADHPPLRVIDPHSALL
jgi:hypothetical protein